MSLRTQMKSEMRPYVDIYVRLASVCDRFYEVVRDKRFRQIIKRTLKRMSYFNVAYVLNVGNFKFKTPLQHDISKLPELTQHIHVAQNMVLESTCAAHRLKRYIFQSCTVAKRLASITSSGAFKPECNGLSQFREDTDIYACSRI